MDLNLPLTFSLPNNFVSQKELSKYTPLLYRNGNQYKSIIDYLNSTIVGISGSDNLIEKLINIIRRKDDINFKSVINARGVLSPKEIDITFEGSDSDLNYWVLFDLFFKKYISNTNLVQQPFAIRLLDRHGNNTYQLNFNQVTFNTISELEIINDDNENPEKVFTMKFRFGYVDNKVK